MAKTRRRTTQSRALVEQAVERISREIFSSYSGIFTDLISSSHGIYALYNNAELYYVGKAIDLKRRVKQHLKDKHLDSWTHFSLYLVRKEEHIKDIESLLIRIANPKGNQAKPKGYDTKELLSKLRAQVKKKQEEELTMLLGAKTRRPARRKQTKTKPKRTDLKRLGRGCRRLKATHNGKEYRAELTPGGLIKLGEKTYSSATAAARDVIGGGRINGRRFWRIRDKNGEWISLRDFAG